MNIKQTAAVSAILMAVVLVGAGCYSSSTTNRPNTPVKPATIIPTPAATQTITNATGPNGSMVTTVSGDTTTVQDDRTKLAFSVPTSLGNIKSQDENGWGPKTAQNENSGPANCLVQRSFLAGDTIFLTAYDTWQCDQPGRGGYWGDQAQAFSSEADVKKWCETKDTCVPYVNKNGVTIYRAYMKSVDSWGDILSDIDEYAAWNPNKDINGILISNQGFVQAGLGRMQEEVKAVADSLSFLE